MKIKIILLALISCQILHANDTSRIFLGDLTPVKIKVGWKSLQINKNPKNGSVTLHGKTCSKYLFAHAASEVSYKIPENVTKFTAYGVMPSDSFGDVNGTWKYSVQIDGITVFKSRDLNTYPNAEVSISVDIPPHAKIIDLVVDERGDSGGDQSIWAEPYFELKTEVVARMWSNKEGRTFEGKLVKSKDNIATVRRILDDKLFTIPVAELSQENQDYVKKTLKGTAHHDNSQRTRITHPLILLKVRSFDIIRENKRTLKYDINIPNISNIRAYLKIGINHTFDDSGDRGITYKINDKDGEIIKQGFLGSKDWSWITQKVKANESYTFYIEDADTVFKGRYPGNSGQIQILLQEKD